MRSTDEQLRAVRTRAAALRRRRERRRRGACAALCLALLTALGCLMPLSPEGGAFTTHDGAFGSFVLSGPALRYIVMAVLGFALGVCFTLLCVHRRTAGKGTEEDTE